MKIYIGVVGQIACGKGVLVDYLTKKLGFILFSLSTIVHDELKKRGISHFTRKTLQDVGDELRRNYGRDILARRAIQQLASTGGAEGRAPADAQIGRYSPPVEHRREGTPRQAPSKFIIEGIRNTAEVEYLKSLPNFTLIGVKAKRESRFNRLLQRRKHWDPKTWPEFLRVDRRDLGVGQKTAGQQVGKCLAYCDYVLTNNKDTDDFYRKVKKLMDRIFKLNSH